MTDYDIITAALNWHAANIKRLKASSENNRYRRASLHATGFGGTHPGLSKRVTEAKRVELAELRKLAKACAWALMVEVIDIDANEPKPLLLEIVKSEVQHE